MVFLNICPYKTQISQIYFHKFIEFLFFNNSLIFLNFQRVDKAELDALETIYCQKRLNPLMIGSVKTQSGHSECCSTLFSIVKVLVAMEEEMLPATLQFENPNPEIKGLMNGKFEVVTKNTKWNSEFAAVNGIGINNYFGHLIIKRNSKAKVITKCDLPPFLPISTRTEETVQTMLAKVRILDCIIINNEND